MEHFSKSALEKYVTCGESYRRRYVVKQEAPTSSNLVFGIAFHTVLEQYVIAHAVDPNLKTFDILDFWQKTYTEELTKHGMIMFDTTSPEEDMDTGFRMLTPEITGFLDSLTPAWMTQVSDEGEKEVPAVEMALSFDIPGVAVPFIGYIDLLQENGIPVDFKTAGRKWSPDKAQKELQPAFYLYGLEQLGRPVPGNWFHHVVITKGKNPTLTLYETQRTQQEIDWALRLAATAYKGITNEVFVPNPLAWICSPSYCEFYDTCMGGENGSA